METTEEYPQELTKGQGKYEDEAIIVKTYAWRRWESCPYENAEMERKYSGETRHTFKDEDPRTERGLLREQIIPFFFI